MADALSYRLARSGRFSGAIPRSERSSSVGRCGMAERMQQVGELPEDDAVSQDRLGTENDDVRHVVVIYNLF